MAFSIRQDTSFVLLNKINSVVSDILSTHFLKRTELGTFFSRIFEVPDYKYLKFNPLCPYMDLGNNE